MKKKLFFAGMLAAALIFGMVLLGCPNDTTEENDTWSDITGLDQMDGTWKGSYSQTMPIREAVEQEGEEWSSEIGAFFGDMKVTVSVEVTTTLNAEAGTQTMEMKITETFSGGNIDTAWPMISGASSSQSGVEIDNSKHSITMYNSSEETISDEDIAEMLGQDLQINQNGTKVKIPAGAMGSGLPEMTLVKQ
ncbi:MAG: hypothetical protein LBB83_03525 [Treponema sp.]|nr:hypothetical protein [Treponema sp.]